MTYEQACKKYGKDNVDEAKKLSLKEGSSSIGLQYLSSNPLTGKCWTTRQVDAMILSK